MRAVPVRVTVIAAWGRADSASRSFAARVAVGSRSSNTRSERRASPLGLDWGLAQEARHLIVDGMHGAPDAYRTSNADVGQAAAGDQRPSQCLAGRHHLSHLSHLSHLTNGDNEPVRSR